MNQHDYCTYSVHQSVSLSLWDVLRQELPNLASFTFCKTSLYRLSSLQGDESQRWSVVLLGRRTCCLAGIEIPCGQWTRETERERNDVICALDLIYLNKKGNNMQKRWDPSLSISTPLFAKQASWRKRRDPRPYPCIWVCRLSDLCCSRWGSTFEGFGSNGDPCYLHLRRWCGRWSGQSAHRLGGNIHCGAIDLEKLKWKTRVSSNVDDTVMPHLTYCKKGGFLIKHHVQRDTYTCYEEGSHNTRSENKHVQRYMKLLRTTPQVCNFNPTFAVHSDTWHSNRSPWGTGAPVQGLYAAGEVTSCPCPRALVWDDGVEDYEGYLEINTRAKMDVGPSKRSRSFSCKDDFSIQHRFL